MDEILSTKNLPEFFRDRLLVTAERIDFDLTEHLEYYLVNLLTHFSQSKNFFEIDDEGHLHQEALIRYFDQSSTASWEQKFTLLKKMGDVSLYVSGLFDESLIRKLVSKDYYMTMGYTAYASVSRLLSHTSRQSMGEIFEDLSFHFKKIVELLNHFKEHNDMKSHQNLLKTYEKWLETGSENLCRLLQEEGIHPTHSGKTYYKQ